MKIIYKNLFVIQIISLINTCKMKEILTTIITLTLISANCFSQTYNCGIFCNKKKHLAYVIENGKKSNENLIIDSEFFLSKHKKHKYSIYVKTFLKIGLDWKEAQNSQTVISYENFISSYPVNKKYCNEFKFYIENAKNEIENLIWKNSRNINTKLSYENYLMKYPNGKFQTKASKFIEEFVWFELEKLNTIERYEKYKKIYPNGPHYNLANLKIEEINWDKAKEINSILSYENYLAKYPIGKNSKVAIQAVVDMKAKPNWDKARKINTISSYRKFNRNYSKSFFYEKSLMKLKELELKLWNKATKLNRIEYYNKYLANFPEGEYVNEAVKKIIKLEIKNEEKRGEFSGELPGNIEQKTDELISLDENFFTIINMTKDIGSKEPHKLKVYYRGITSKGYVNGNYNVEIDDCVEKIFIPGEYYFTIEAIGDSEITKYRNSYPWTFKGKMRSRELSLGVFPKWGPLKLIPTTDEEKKAENQRIARRDKKYYKCFSAEYKSILDSY